MPALTNETHERYARLRAVLVPPRAAIKSMGGNPKTGQATKLERNAKIRERIVELSGDTEAIIREKREQIEAALSAIAYGDGSEFPYLKTRPALKWPDRLGAIGQLRDMHGFKAPSRVEATGKDGSPLMALLCEIDGSSRGLPTNKGEAVGS